MLASLVNEYHRTDNHWALMVTKNLDILTEKNKETAKYFSSRIETNKISGFDNVFCTDGYSMECIIDITNNLIDINNKQKIHYPNVDVNGATIFCSYAEGWAKDDFFEALHNIIDLLQLQGKIVYTTGSVNIEECYDKFCKKYNKTQKMICKYNGSPLFFQIDNKNYALPKEAIEELTFENKKLFCTFNWNAWSHRLALIALLNHYNLIDDGYISSPTKTKYNYDPENDFSTIKYGCLNYINQLPDSEQILNNLEKLKSIYPLKIDDRSKYTHTDQPLTQTELKMPMLKARINSIFEVVSETRWFGEHFLSEKTFNPVALGKPVIILAASGMLKSFRKLGFKTFNGYVDESYDNIENDAERTLAIVKELVRLKNMRNNNTTDFNSLVENCDVIAQYNLEFFINNAAYPKNLYFRYDDYTRFIELC